MPANAPKSLSNTEVYQVIAYVLYMNGLIDQYKVINAETLLALKMPNAGGFVDMSASD
jgi:cytochrome c